MTTWCLTTNEDKRNCNCVHNPTFRYLLAATLSKSRGCPLAMSSMPPISTPKSACQPTETRKICCQHVHKPLAENLLLTPTYCAIALNRYSWNPEIVVDVCCASQQPAATHKEEWLPLAPYLVKALPKHPTQPTAMHGSPQTTMPGQILP